MIHGSLFVKPFKSPRQYLGELDAEKASGLVLAASDVALVIDAKGVIRDLCLGTDELSEDGCGEWVGKPWAQTVTAESRGKVDALLREAGENGPTRWRHVNQQTAGGGDLPVLYATVPLVKGRTLAVGRNLRAVATLQQRLVEAQQAMERDYARLRSAEMRYRLLFQTAPQAMLVVDAGTLRVLEANPQAVAALGEAGRDLVGTTFPDGLDADSTVAVQRLVASVRSAGRAEDIAVAAADGARRWTLSLALFRQENAPLLLVRLTPAGQPVAAAAPSTSQVALLELVEAFPDGLVVTDDEGTVISANAAFLELVQAPSEDAVRGQPLTRWVGRANVDVTLLLNNLQQHGAVRLFTTTLRGDLGLTAEVEISATIVPDGGSRRYGFTLRNIGRRLAPDTRDGRGELPRSVGQLTELIGRVPLKDIVRQTTDVIERLCIESALELTGDNRASAAEMLGLSRQSLYVKLRRYGLGDLDAQSDL